MKASRWLCAYSSATFSSIIFNFFEGSISTLLEEEKQATMLSSKVGEYVVFNCPVDFPHDYIVPYILRWNKEVIP
jgi:hypothetical protein